jgi:hypothetical protein
MFMDKPYIVFAQALTDSLLLHVSKAAVYDELNATTTCAGKCWPAWPCACTN